MRNRIKMWFPDQSIHRRVRISIRVKLLLVISFVLLTAMGTYLYLATTLFSRDKLAYVNDLNAGVVDTLSNESLGRFDVLIRQARLFGREPSKQTSYRIRKAEFNEFFKIEPNVIRVEILSNVSPNGEYAGRKAFINPRGIDALGMSQSDLKDIRRNQPLPLGALGQPGAEVVIKNTSLEPDISLLTIAFNAGDKRVIVMDVHPTQLLRMFNRSKLHETYLVDHNGVVLSHPDPSKVIQRTRLGKHALVRKAIESRFDRGVIEFEENQTTYLGAYAKINFGRLRVLTQVPKSVALQASRELIRRSLLFGIAIVLVAFLASILFARLIAAPIRTLQKASESIALGHYSVNVQVHSNDELGDLAKAFTKMASALNETQQQLVQSEKMAAYGQLGAGITHEVKNPMTGIIGFAQLAQRKVEDPDKTLELLKLIEKEGLRCRDILVNFLKFARQSEGTMAHFNINPMVNGTANLLSHQLNMTQVKMKVDLCTDDLEIYGNSAELQQVLMNMGINAAQAMDQGGSVTFRTSAEDGFVCIRVTDDGPGIPDDIKTRVFDPFFTTKPAGEGTGLGLSVSFGIIQSHRGKVDIESTQGEGTTFLIRLPCSNSAQATTA